MRGSREDITHTGEWIGDSSLKPPRADYRRLRKVFVISAIVSALAVTATFVAFQLRAERMLLDNITSQARAHVREFEAVREYVSAHGGVYVPRSAKAMPNPHLPSDSREIRAEDGKRYVLQNSPLVARRISALLADDRVSESDTQVLLRMVQERPLDPANAPDRWERESLRQLQSGAGETYSFVERGGRTRFLYAYPVVDNGTCRRCHIELPRAKVGSVFGATVVDMDVTAPMQQIRESRMSAVLVLFIIITALGTATYLIVTRLLRGLLRAQTQLVRLACTDELTGIANRRTGMERLAVELERARRSDQPLSCVLLDLDDFKRVNDTLGHSAGDTVLKAASWALARAARRYDTVSRVGGEEFLVLLPGIGADAVLEIAERVRRAISAECSALAGIKRTVTASAGVAIAAPGTDESPDQLLARADRALYRAKRKGRDRTVVSRGLGEASEHAGPDRGPVADGYLLVTEVRPSD